MATSKGEPIRLLTELDALLDTRLGLMDVLDPDAAVRLISSMEYFTRQEDRFEAICGFPDEVYREMWKKRDIQTLQHSIVTPTLSMVHLNIMKIESQALTDPTVSGAMLDINFYPYKLTEKESDEMTQALLASIGLNTPIRLLWEPYEAFTPESVKAAYEGMILYNYNDWLLANGKALFEGEIGIPGVSLVAPRLAADRMPDISKYDFSARGVKKALDPFETAAFMMTQYIHLEFVGIEHYCIAYPNVGTPHE